MSDRDFDLLAAQAVEPDVLPLGRVWNRVQRAIGPSWFPTFGEILFATALAASILALAFQATKPSLPPTEPLGTRTVATSRPGEGAYQAITRLAGLPSF